MIYNFTYLNKILLTLINKNDKIKITEYNLSGSRYSGKTYSSVLLLVSTIIVALKYNLSVAIYVFRKLNKDIGELVTDIFKALDSFGLIEKVHFTFKSPNKQGYFTFGNNKSFIRVMGVYNRTSDRVPLKGLSRREIENFDLCIEFIEEANEFTKAEFQAITFAIGLANQKITIRCCNPDSLNQYYINYLNERVPFDIETLKKNNEQLKVIKENNLYKLFHYTNWKVNKHLNIDTINKLKELKEYDPLKAQSWYYGIPSVLNGAIFARILDKAKTKLDFHPFDITGGLDLGFATTPTGHPTAGSLWFIGKDNTGLFRLHKEYEYFHANATMKYKDTDKIANEIINYYVFLSKKYPLMQQKGFTCYVDDSNIVFIERLNKLSEQIRWLNFRSANKQTISIKDRIDAFTIGILNGNISYNWDNCPNTLKQMNQMQWLEKKNDEIADNEPKMLDKYDDNFDSDCYAVLRYIRDMLNSMQNSILFDKNRFGVFNAFTQ